MGAVLEASWDKVATKVDFNLEIDHARFLGVGYVMADNEHGVYAVSERELAIPFVISYRPLGDEAGFSVETSERPPRIVLKDTRKRLHWTAFCLLSL